MPVTEIDVSTLSNDELDKLLAEVDIESSEVVEEKTTKEKALAEAPAEAPAEASAEAPAEAPAEASAEASAEPPVNDIPRIDIEQVDKLPPLPTVDDKTVTPEDFLNDPVKAVKDINEHEKLKHAVNMEKNRREFLKKTEETKNVILKVMPDFEKHIPGMVSYLQEAKLVPEDMLKVFEQNPYATQNVPLLHTMAVLAKERNTRKQENKEVLKNAHQSSAIKPTSITKDIVTKSRPVNVSDWTDAQLDEFLTKAQVI